MTEIAFGVGPESGGRRPRIGVDIGRVIIGGEARQSEQTLFGNDPLNAPEIHGAIDSIAALSDSADWEKIYLVSKCALPVEIRTLDWLEARDFHTRTGISVDDIYFCRDVKDKAPVARQLRLTHFIDDRISVLHQMHGIVPVRLLFGVQRYIHNQAGITSVLNWAEAMTELERTKSLGFNRTAQSNTTHKDRAR